jgi:aminoglycoside phosphotransferase (APT) family kinase protein
VSSHSQRRPDLPGLPFASVDAWLRSALPDLVGDQPWSVDLISGGLSNITFRLHTAGGELILRRPPLGGVLPSAHDMQREFTVLSALYPSAVPVPEPMALCSDAEVLGYPFYVMAAVPGRVLRTAQDTEALDIEQRRRVSEELVTTMAALHAVDVDQVGLSDYGRADGYSARQIKRWGQQWERSRTRDLPDMNVLLTRLSGALPAHADATIVHGDYRLDNTIIDLSFGQPKIVAVVDWELSTLGDPLADLGLTLTYWHDRDDAERSELPVAIGVTTPQGFPSSAEFAERYSQLTGRDLSDLPFYRALGAMKLAVIMEGVHARHIHGHTISGGYEGAGDAVPAMVARALHQLPG